MTIGERFKLVRETVGSDKKLSQTAFGDALKVGRDVIANIEQGRTIPTDVIISYTCAKYNINESWLRAGEGEMFTDLSDVEEIAQFMSSLIKPTDDAETQKIKRNFIIAVSKLSTAEWKTLAELAKSWSDANNGE